MHIRQIIGIVAVILGLAGYAPYLRDLFAGKTKPHIFSWGIWFILETTSFLIQWHSGAGPGSWVSFFSAIGVGVIFCYSFKYAKLSVRPLDWVCLAGAILSFVLWAICGEPAIAAVCLAATDLFAFIPTFRKTWNNPHDETLFEYAMASAKFALAFLAFDVFTLASVIYPLYLVVANTIFVIMTLVRRQQTKQKK